MVYLLHFDRPYKHARHFVGVAHSSFGEPGTRVSREQLPPAPLVQAAAADGIIFTIAQTWPGNTPADRHVYAGKRPARFCELCRAEKVGGL